LPPVTRSTRTDSEVLAVSPRVAELVRGESALLDSPRLTLRSSELESWLEQKFSNASGVATSQSLQLARQLAGDPALLDRWVRSVLDQGDPSRVFGAGKFDMASPFDLLRRSKSPFDTALSGGRLGSVDRTEQLPAEIQTIVERWRAEQELSRSGLTPYRTPEQQVEYFLSFPQNTRDEILSTVAQEAAKKVELRLRKVDALEAFAKEEIFQAGNQSTIGRIFNGSLYTPETYALEGLVSAMPEIRTRVMGGATVREAIRDANVDNRGYTLYDIHEIFNAGWRASNLLIDVESDDLSDVSATDVKVLSHMRELGSYDHLEQRSFQLLHDQFVDKFAGLVTEERKAEIHSEADESIRYMVGKHIDSWRNPSEADRARGAQPMTEEQITNMTAQLIAQKEQLLTMQEIASKLDPRALTPDSRKIWDLYNDVMDPQGEWLNLKDSTKDRIFEEVIINVPLLLASGGTANIAKAGLTTMAREVAGRLVVREVLETGVEIGVKDTAQIIGKKWFAETVTRRLALGVPVVLAEGAVFETTNQALHGEWIGNQEHWVKQILWSAATLGAFHQAGNLANGAFRVVKKDAGMIVYNEAGQEVKELTRLGQMTEKISDKNLRELTEQLILKGHVTAAAMLITGAAQHGVFDGNAQEVYKELGGQIFQAYLSSGALTIAHSGIRTAGGKMFAAPREPARPIFELQQTLERGAPERGGLLPLAEMTVGDATVRGRVGGNGRAVYVESVGDVRKLYEQSYGRAPGENVVGFWEPGKLGPDGKRAPGRLVTVALSPEATSQQRREWAGRVRHELAHLEGGAGETDAYLEQARLLARPGADGSYRMIFENGTYRVERVAPGERVTLPSRESIDSFIRNREQQYSTAAVEQPAPTPGPAEAARRGVIRDVTRARTTLGVPDGITELSQQSIQEYVARQLNEPANRFDPAKRAAIQQSAAYLTEVGASVDQLRAMAPDAVTTLPRLTQRTTALTAAETQAVNDWSEACRRIGVDPAKFDWKHFGDYERNARSKAAESQGPDSAAARDRVEAGLNYIRQHRSPRGGSAPAIDAPQIRSLNVIEGDLASVRRHAQALGISSNPATGTPEFYPGELDVRRREAVRDGRLTQAEADAAAAGLRSVRATPRDADFSSQTRTAFEILGLGDGNSRPKESAVKSAADKLLRGAATADAVRIEAARDFLLQFAEGGRLPAEFPNSAPKGSSSLSEMEARSWQSAGTRASALDGLGFDVSVSTPTTAEVNSHLRDALKGPGADRAALMARADYLRDLSAGVNAASLPDVSALESAYRSKYAALKTLGYEFRDPSLEPVFTRKQLDRLYADRVHAFERGEIKDPPTRAEIEGAYKFLDEALPMDKATAYKTLGLGRIIPPTPESVELSRKAAMLDAVKKNSRPLADRVEEAYQFMCRRLNVEPQPWTGERPVGNGEGSNRGVIGRVMRATAPSYYPTFPSTREFLGAARTYAYEHLPAPVQVTVDAVTSLPKQVMKFVPLKPESWRAWSEGRLPETKPDGKSPNGTYIRPEVGTKSFEDVAAGQAKARDRLGLDENAELPSRRFADKLVDSISAGKSPEEIRELRRDVRAAFAHLPEFNQITTQRVLALGGKAIAKEWFNPWTAAAGLGTSYLLDHFAHREDRTLKERAEAAWNGSQYTIGGFAVQYGGNVLSDDPLGKAKTVFNTGKSIVAPDAGSEGQGIGDGGILDAWRRGSQTDSVDPWSQPSLGSDMPDSPYAPRSTRLPAQAPAEPYSADPWSQPSLGSDMPDSPYVPPTTTLPGPAPAQPYSPPVQSVPPADGYEEREPDSKFHSSLNRNPLRPVTLGPAEPSSFGALAELPTDGRRERLNELQLPRTRRVS